MFKRLQNLERESQSYPPYNLYRDGDIYTIEMALAGLSAKDIDIELKEQVLTISYRKQDEIKEDVLHKGLAHRSFTRSFNLAEDIKVKKAKLNNGLLSIILERIIPEDKKPVKIKIS
jgi:molecular chaperone IbpA